MDLDKYKKAWDNQPEETDTVSKVDIYKMAHSKSSSIVKWIFIIGILEFSFWILLNFCFSKTEHIKVYEDLNMMGLLDSVFYFNLIIIVGFLYCFYKNYTSISSTDSTKKLMKKIIRTRKTVKYYMYYNIIGGMLIMIVFNLIIINTPNAIETIMSSEQLNIDSSNLLTIYLISQAIAVVFMLLFLFVFYYLLYGIMLKKLNKNHKELTKLEDLN